MGGTAPVPNLPAPPGMCPGNIVLAGGGDGGDGSGDGAGGGKNEKGAGGKKGKNDPNGDGKGAKGCGAGSGAGPCTNCGAKPSAGDPVDIASGEVFTAPIVDLFLPGPMNLEVQRKYSSRTVNRDVGLGSGWSFTFGWRLYETEHDVTVVDGSGYSVMFKRPAVGELNESQGWVLERERDGYVLGCGTPFVHHFRTLPSSPNRWLLAYVLGPGFNKIVLHYDDDCRLRSITDTAGRKIDLQLTSEGRMSAIEVRDPGTGATITFATYTYDEHGNLVSAMDADGVIVRYEYGRDHLLARMRYASGLTYHWVYDKHNRCIETWGDHPDRRPDPALADDLPEFLADGRTRAKGLHHVKINFDSLGGREVVASTEVLTFLVDENESVRKAVGNGGVTTREFDANGHVDAETDRNGATRKFERDFRGRVLQEIDPMGNTLRIARNSAGQVLEATDAAGGTIKFTRDGRGFVETIQDQLGGVTQYRWDERGLMKEQIHPNGGRSTYAVDVHGNLVEARLPDGSLWRWRYDFWGRPLERVDPLSRSTHYLWTPAGRLSEVRERDGSSVAHHYDAMGDRTKMVRGDGRVWEWRWGGVHWLCDKIEPNGDVVQYRYDREGRLVALHNERREVARFEWDTNGGLTKETTFDGRAIHRGYDAMGNLLWEDFGHGKIEYTFDEAGRISEVTYPDGGSEQLSWNARRELVGIKGPTTEVTFELNAKGQIVRENVAGQDGTISVESAYTQDGIRARLKTSLGHTEHFARDAVGQVSAMMIDESERVGFHRDPLGRLLRLSLPRGGVVASEYDPLTRLSRRRVVAAGQVAEATRPGEPEWMGELRGKPTVDNAYQYNLGGNLVAERKLDSGLTRFELDARDRLVVRAPERGEPELFSYDATSNVSFGGRGAEYEPGNKLVALGTTRYAYDEAGFLLEKTVQRSDGSDDVWEYEWSAERVLSAVVKPDGTRVEFDYLPLLRRRIQKRVLDVLPDGSYRLRSKTRYVWDEERLVQEERISLADDGHEVSCRLRTFVFEDSHAYSPFAEHVTTTTGDARDDQWLFFATDFIGTPEEIVHADGTLAARIERSAYGQMRMRGEAATDLRLPGQLEDEETGLVYNFFRYYDPETGRYISPDPLGLVGNLNLYLYCTNPVYELDPYGLMPMDFAVDDANGGSVIPQMQLNSGQSPGFTGAPWNNLRTGHAERKALSMLDNNPAAMDALKKGGTAKMSAPYPPCSVCHRRMEKWAQDNLKEGGKIDYNYPVNQNITYDGNGASGAAGQPSGNLVNAYNNNSVVPNPNIPGKNTTSGSLEYQSQKAASQTAIDNNGGTTQGIVNWP